MDARAIILEILHQESSNFIHKISENIIAKYNVSQIDRNFIHEITQGVKCYQGTLKYIIGAYSHAKPSPKIYNCLLLALYQFFYLEKIPSYAIVDSTVKLAKNIDYRASKYVNALLRRVQREVKKIENVPFADNFLPLNANEGWLFPVQIFPSPQKDMTQYLSVVYSYPEFLVKKWLQNFGAEKCIELLVLGNMRPWTTLRIRHKENFCSYMESMCVSHDLEKSTAVIASMGNIRNLPGYNEGDWVVQGLSSMETINKIRVTKDMIVLDVCAAPGGKCFQVADAIQNNGFIFACDKSVTRLKHLQENQHRLGVTNVVSIAMDGESLPKSFLQKFDLVLADVPCSNSAVLAKRTEARWRFNKKNLEELATMQKKILMAAAAAVKKGGMLIYSTCSLEIEENEEIIASFLKQYTDFSCADQQKMFPQIPFLDGGTFFVLLRDL